MVSETFKSKRCSQTSYGSYEILWVATMSNLPCGLFSSQLESLRCCKAKQTGCVALVVNFAWYCILCIQMCFATATPAPHIKSRIELVLLVSSCDVPFALWPMNQLPLPTSGNWMISQLLLQKLKIYWTSSRVMKAECPKLFFAVLRRSSARHDLTQGAGCDRSTRRR